MNTYAWIVLVALIGELALSVVTSLLNIRAMHPTVPDEFRPAYDDETYARSQAYTRTRTRFGLAHDADIGVAGAPGIGAPGTRLKDLGLAAGIVGQFGAGADKAVFGVDQIVPGARFCGRFEGLQLDLALGGDDDLTDGHELLRV